MTDYPPIVYPHGKAWQGPRPPATGIHTTSGLRSNKALDFMAPGGINVLAVERGVITKLSGHDPADGEVAPGIFGWSVYYTTRAGLIYFCTHLGHRIGKVGDPVVPGTLLGQVGHWPNDEPRSHTHLGVTHPDGVEAAKRRILLVSQAPRVRYLDPAT